MPEKRTFPRKKKRLVVDFVADGSRHTGFTWDLSFTGLNIASSFLPGIGAKLSANLHLPDGKMVACEGRVVRAKRVPSALAASAGHGFSVEISGYFEEYFRYLSTL